LGPIVDKARPLEEVVGALEPFPSAPPVSQLAPAVRARSSGSGAHLTRVNPEEDGVVESVASTSSSRR